MWHATPHLASLPCGGWSAVVPGAKVSDAASRKRKGVSKRKGVRSCNIATIPPGLRAMSRTPGGSGKWNAILQDLTPMGCGKLFVAQPRTLEQAGGSPAAGHLSCAAKKGNRKKAAPGVAPRVRGVPPCCLPRWGDCATRPGEAHTTCLTAGLEQCSSTSPHRVELLGAPQGEIVKLENLDLVRHDENTNDGDRWSPFSLLRRRRVIPLAAKHRSRHNRLGNVG
jgi:hypothetical protein